ncbi:MAG: TonB-dependent receptor [Pseudomonadota bacterium]
MRKITPCKTIPSMYYYSCLSFSVALSTTTLAHETLSPPAIEEVVVTAQMREENIQSVPIAIGVYNNDFLANIGASSLTETEYAIPNINFGAGGRNTRGEISIRGVGAYSRNIGNDARIVVYVDGVLTGRSSTFDQSLIDVERIEVLRGPQGTLSGANAIVGVINIVTETPHDKPSFTLLTDIGNFDLRSVTGKLNLPVTADLYASLLVGTTKQDGFVDNVTFNKHLQDTDRENAKLKFRYVGIENLTIDLGFDYLNDDAQSSNAQAIADVGKYTGFSLAPAPRDVAHNAEEFSQRELTSTTINAHYLTAQNYEIVSTTGLRKSEFSELSEEDYSPFDVATSLFDEKNTQLSQEFRLVSPQHETADYVIGVFFLDQDISTERHANFGADAAGIQSRYPSNSSVAIPASANTKSYAAYSNGNWRFTNKWEATGGIRYIYETKNIDYSSIDTTGRFINERNLRDNETYKELLPKVGLNFHYSPNILMYGAISRGYKSGGWNADFISTLENFQINPEYAINYELGIKSTFFDDRLTLNTAAFSTKFHDFQVLQFAKDGAGNIIIFYTNAGKVTSQGFELDTKMKIYSDLSVSFNAALTKAKFDEFKNGDSAGNDYDNNKLPFAPEHTYYLALDYQHDFSESLTLYGHIDYGYSGSYFSHPDNRLINATSHHYIANSRLGVKIDDGWDISLWIKNITNETNLRQRSVSFLGIPRGYYDPPRSFGLTVKYNYN